VDPGDHIKTSNLGYFTLKVNSGFIMLSHAVALIQGLFLIQIAQKGTGW